MILFPNVSLLQHSQCDWEQAETARTHKGTGARGGRGVVSGRRDPLCPLFGGSPQRSGWTATRWGWGRAAGASAWSRRLPPVLFRVEAAGGRCEQRASSPRSEAVPPALRAAVTGSPPRVHPPSTQSPATPQTQVSRKSSILTLFCCRRTGPPWQRPERRAGRGRFPGCAGLCPPVSPT